VRERERQPKRGEVVLYQKCPKEKKVAVFAGCGKNERRKYGRSKRFFQNGGGRGRKKTDVWFRREKKMKEGN